MGRAEHSIRWGRSGHSLGEYFCAVRASKSLNITRRVACLEEER